MNTASMNAAFHWTGWSLAALGIVFIAAAAAGRRARYPRCPRCRYDMTGLPGLLCPECGHAAYDAAALRRRGRSPWLAVAGVVVIAAGWAAWTTPRARKHGWPGWIPTTVLVLGYHWTSSESYGSVSNRLGYELRRRLDDDAAWAAWDWQWDLAIDRCLRGDPCRPPLTKAWVYHYGGTLHGAERAGKLNNAAAQAGLERLGNVIVTTRPEWPADVPVVVLAQPCCWQPHTRHRFTVASDLPGRGPTFMMRDNRYGSHWRDRHPVPSEFISLGVVDPAVDTVGFRITVETPESRWNPTPHTPTHTASLPIRFVGSVDEILTPVRDPAVDADIRARLQPLLRRVPTQQGSGLWLDFAQMGTRLGAMDNVTLALDVEILLDGRVVGRAQRWTWAGKYSCSTTVGWFGDRLVHVVPDALADTPPGSGAWTVRIRDNPVLALNNFRWSQYWAGELELSVLCR